MPIIERQIQSLEAQIEQANRLRRRLTQLRDRLTRGEKPELADWLATLEMMTVYDKYFSANELKRLPLLNTDENAVAAEWVTLVTSVREALDARVPAESPVAQALAKRWMNLLIRDTNGDPRLLAKLNTMHHQEPSVQAQTGVTPEVMTYIQQAFAETKLAIYKRYLSPDEFLFMRENYGKRSDEWPALLGAIRQHMEDGTAPDDRKMQRRAQQWIELVRSYAGNNPQTLAKIDAAHAAEPELLAGTFIDCRLLAYVVEAMSGLKPNGSSVAAARSQRGKRPAVRADADPVSRISSTTVLGGVPTAEVACDK